jgi:hypothetical protein
MQILIFGSNLSGLTQGAATCICAFMVLLQCVHFLAVPVLDAMFAQSVPRAVQLTQRSCLWLFGLLHCIVHWCFQPVGAAVLASQIVHDCMQPKPTLLSAYDTRYCLGRPRDSSALDMKTACSMQSLKPYILF